MLFRSVGIVVKARLGDDNQAMMDLDVVPWRVEESPAPEDVDEGDRWLEVLYHITI